MMHKRMKWAWLLPLWLLVMACASGGPLLAQRGLVVEALHGAQVADPYRSLEDADDPNTQAWTQAQNVYARKQLQRYPEREALRQRLTDLSYIAALGTPSRHGSRYFLRKRKKKQEKSAWYWRESKHGKLQWLLDPNHMSEDGSVALKGVYPSYDGQWVAYKLSENNADEASMHVMNVSTGKRSVIDTIAGAKYAQASWDPQSKGFYYTRLPVGPAIPAAERPGHAEVYYHRLGTLAKQDTLVHEKTGDPKIFLHPWLSRDGRFLFVYKSHGWGRNDLYLKDMQHDTAFRPFVVGLDAQFSATAWKGKIYLRTNHQASRYRVYRIDPQKLSMAAWELIVPEDRKAVLQSLSVIGDHLVLNYLENASSRLQVRSLAGQVIRDIQLPGIGSVFGPSGNPEDDEFYYAFSSYTRPTTIYSSSVQQGGRAEYFKVEAPVDPSAYEVEQVWYPSKDGTRISMFLVHAKNMKRDGSTPFLLTGYGGFNSKKVPVFSPRWFAWLERGGGLAIPNLRGGGEYGEAWHRAGMLGNKQNVFDDFSAAAEYLISHGYTRPQKLAIRGASNGGLLVGAAMVQRPELFGAVVCGVPLLDMLRYHKFGSGKTWISEYGSAEDPEQFKALQAYSPYHHVQPGVAYPPLLMLSADSDDRVDPMHARKFVAAVQHAHPSGQVLLRIDGKSGHGGGDMVKKTVAREVDVYGFLFEVLGM